MRYLRTEQAFTLIELLIVILIVGILAAVAAPLYLGYVRDAKLAEGKSYAGALWVAIQGMAVAACDSDIPVTSAFQRAGLTTGGATPDGRWTATAGGNVKITCSTGAITTANPIFTFSGKADSDVGNLKVGLFYNLANSPPSVLRCMTDGATPTEASPAC